MRPVPRLDLPVHVDRTSTLPLHRQLAEVLRRAVLDGRLAPGARLPSTREAGREVGVARATVLAAYEQLVGEGYLQARPGSGTFVGDHVAAPAPADAVPRRPVGTTTRTTPAPVDLRPGRPDVARLVDPAWRQAWRRAAARVTSGEPGPAGTPALRDEIAAHLRAARGVAARAEDVVVTAGTGEGTALLVHALGLAGAVVAVEDPGYPSARRCLTRLGVALQPVPVDGDGLRVDLLPDARHLPGGGPVRAVLVTPSHQYPRGGVLPLPRRLALLAWARDHDAVVLEDDYDSEFRYGAAPLPALAGLDPDRVVHLGTFSKVLTPALRAGFLLVPPRLHPAVLAVRRDLGTPVSGIGQDALADYLAGGALRRHIARCRRDYAHRRAHLLRLLQAQPSLGAVPTTAGLHAVVTLPPSSDAAAVVDRVRARGFLVADLADYAAPDGTAGRGEPAVVLGYGDATLRDLDGVVRALAGAVTP